jgi:hypothetical protein
VDEVDCMMEVNTSGTLRGPVTHEAEIAFVHVAEASPVLEIMPEMTLAQQLAQWKEYAARLEDRCASLTTYSNDLAEQVNELDSKLRSG